MENEKMLTLADLKRDAQAGNLCLRMTYRYGEEIRERLRGPRKVLSANSNSISLLCSDGQLSKLDLPRASLVEYTDKRLTNYDMGYRKPNAEEQAALDEWSKISSTEEYKNDSYNDMMTDGSSTFYQKKEFWHKKNMDYMFFNETDHLKQYDRNKGMVRDPLIKGEKLLEYEVIRS